MIEGPCCSFHSSNTLPHKDTHSCPQTSSTYLLGTVFSRPSVRVQSCVRALCVWELSTGQLSSFCFLCLCKHVLRLLSFLRLSVFVSLTVFLASPLHYHWTAHPAVISLLTHTHTHLLTLSFTLLFFLAVFRFSPSLFILWDSAFFSVNYRFFLVSLFFVSPFALFATALNLLPNHVFVLCAVKEAF